jgi:signal transduction histidine kinase
MVDDLPQNLLALDNILQRDGLVLLKASSALEALELLLRHEVALALVDIQMPDMDGFELAELMRGLERTRRVPIIFLTAGSTDQQRRFRGYEAGAVDFLSKPVEAHILKSKAMVFFELYRQQQEVAAQRDELEEINRENERLLAESRQYAQALQDADRRKDEFLATLAHELRNPLAPIRNSVQMLQMSGAPEQAELNVYRIIERQVNHMVRLVDDLLELSRITSGKIELQPEIMDLADVIHNAIETSRPLLETGGRQFSVTLPFPPLTIEGDLVRLTQVLANLLNNAAKYTPEGGSITLVAERSADQAQISIRDTGMGIPPAMLGQVFDMFTQINRHLKRSQGGLGIGLMLVKRLVELHGGIVEVFSDGEGLGAEFIVRLPLVNAALDSIEVRVPDPGGSVDAERILVIDDNADCLNSLSMLLKLYGHEVATAQNGHDGIEAVEAFRPTVVILDLGMPDMDGYETARRMRSLDAGRDVLLVALTGWGQEQDRSRTREAGFDVHLIKPVESAALQNLLSTKPGRYR